MKSRKPPRRDPKRRSRTRSEYVASLNWNIEDARDALKAAVSMSDWAGVIKYAKQLQVLTRKHAEASRERGPKHEWARPRTAAEFKGHEERRRRGRSGVP